MIIDFSGGITESRVQQMIDDALDFTAGIINLSNATADEVKKAFLDPDRIMCIITYSGITYVEDHRTYQASGENINIVFYIVGAEADNQSRRIFDKRYTAIVTPSTGEVHFSTSNYDFAPDIIYDLDKMNTEQLVILSQRLRSGSGNATKRFGVVWTYNGKQYIYSAGEGYSTPAGNVLMGTTAISVNFSPTIAYDMVYLDTDGTITHHEYTSNIALTAVQP